MLQLGAWQARNAGRLHRSRSPLRYMRAPGVAKGSGRKRFSVSSGRFKVTSGNPGAADADFARDARWHRAEILIHEINPKVRYGHTDHAAHATGQVGLADDSEGGVDRGFGDAVHVHDHGFLIAMLFEPGFEALQLQGFTGANHETQVQVMSCGR